MFNMIATKVMLAATAATSAPTAASINEVADELTGTNTTVQQKTSFMLNYFLAQREPLLNFLRKLILAILVLYIGHLVIKLILKITNKWMTKIGVEASVHKFSLSLIKAVLYILIVFAAAGILGLGGSTIVALIGSAGLTIGLALQGSLSNFAGGVLILLLKPFKVGDYVITSGGEGTVKSIDIFYTRLITSDNKVIVLPNGSVSNSSVTNVSALETRMLILDFMVPAGCDIEKVKKDILKDMKSVDKIEKDMLQDVVISKIYPQHVKLTAKMWVQSADYWEVNEIMLQKIKKCVDMLR